MAVIQDDVFVEEVRNVKQTAFGVAYLILKNTYDCEDAMSSAILKAYEHREKLKKRSSFRAWFLQILRNEAYTILRERRKVFDTDEIPEIPNADTDSSVSLDLRDALMRLPEDKRNVLYLWQEGYSMEEIAQILDAPVGTIKSRIARAKETLRSYLEVS